MGSFEISEGNITGRKKTPQSTHLTTAASRDGEAAQTLPAATGESGLGREARAAPSVLGVRPGPESPENNLGEIM